jgi:DNA-binding GntR family transcriptional regulator
MPKPNSSNVAIKTIVRLIVEGQLSPGASVTEEGLAARLKMSRTPIREAIRHLVTLGLLERKSPHGLQAAPFSIEQAIQVLCIREELECLTLRLSGGQIPKKELYRLREELLAADAASCRDEQGLQQKVAASAHVHELLADSAASAPLRQILAVLQPHATRERYFSMKVWHLLPERMRVAKRAHRQHLAIIDALLADRVAAAEKTLREHLREVRELLIERFGVQARGEWTIGSLTDLGGPAKGGRGPRRRRTDLSVE